MPSLPWETRKISILEPTSARSNSAARTISNLFRLFCGAGVSGGVGDSIRDGDTNPGGVCKDAAGATLLPSVDGVLNEAGATTNCGDCPSVKGIETGDSEVELLGLFARFRLLYVGVIAFPEAGR